MLPVPMGRSVATAAAALFLAAPAAGAVTVGQGDAVVVNGSECTVGFNGERESFTAAHCGTSGDRVRKVLDDGTWSPAIGTLDTSPRSEETTNDWARIRWDAGVELGPNEYTGDAQIPLDDIRRGETVCYYGWATGAATCGTYYARVGNSFLVDVEPGAPGDSGGPMWIPGRGFVGVHSASLEGRDNLTGRTKAFTLGATTADGGPIRDAIIDVFVSYFSDDAQAGAPKPPPPEPTGSSDSWLRAVFSGALQLLLAVLSLIFNG